jgi:glycosyltransferase involved in cell wall biosynthesis
VRYRLARPDRLLTIHNGVPDGGTTLPEIREQTPTIIMVARFAEQKDQRLLVEACAQIKAPYRLEFAGSGETQADVRRRVQELGLEDRVDFLGDCSDVASRLERASIFVLATNWEGFPLSILEAMRAGLPIVASDVGGVREAVCDGENGFLTPRGDRMALAGAIEKLVTDRQLRTGMGRNSRRIFEERFTVGQMLRKTLDLYRQLTSVQARVPETSVVSKSA